MGKPVDRMIFRNASSSPLGSVTMGGFLRNSRGLGHFRVYGQYALVFLLEGSGRYRDVNGVDRAVGSGDVMVVFPDLGQRYGPGPGERWSEYHVCFNGPVFDLWRQGGLLDPRHPVFHLEPVDHWLKRFESILGVARQGGFALPLGEVCRLQQLLADIVSGDGRRWGRSDDLKWAARACALLEGEPEGCVDLGEVAGSLGMSYESFRKRFTRVVGQPPARYRMARLMDRACELMQAGRALDKEIAGSLGFCDHFHFSRRFKQIVGESPRQFRQRIRRMDVR
jgi:AraC-like DNA-binding protein